MKHPYSYFAGVLMRSSTLSTLNVHFRNMFLGE